MSHHVDLARVRRELPALVRAFGAGVDFVRATANNGLYTRETVLRNINNFKRSLRARTRAVAYIDARIIDGGRYAEYIIVHRPSVLPRDGPPALIEFLNTVHRLSMLGVRLFDIFHADISINNYQTYIRHMIRTSISVRPSRTFGVYSQRSHRAAAAA